jgi:hypothetical protein
MKGISLIGMILAACSSESAQRVVYIERDDSGATGSGGSAGSIAHLDAAAESEASPNDAGHDSGLRTGSPEWWVCDTPEEKAMCGDLGDGCMGDPFGGCGVIQWRIGGDANWQASESGCASWKGAGVDTRWCSFPCAGSATAADTCYAMGARCCSSEGCVEAGQIHTPGGYGSTYCCPRDRCP